METKELQEMLESKFSSINYTLLQSHGFDKVIISAMQEVAKLSHNNAIRLASESMPKKCGCSDGCCYNANEYTSIILELLKP